jgi:hypothetical protein
VSEFSNAIDMTIKARWENSYSLRLVGGEVIEFRAHPSNVIHGEFGLRVYQEGVARFFPWLNVLEVSHVRTRTRGRG